MQKPGFVTLNGHRIKVQRWRQDNNAFTFTTVIHGEHMGNDIIAAVESAQVSLVADEDIALDGTARLLDRRATGVGPTAVVRLEIQFTAEGDAEKSMQLTADQKLDAILSELRTLRREVDALRGRPSVPAGSVAPPAPGKTMIDFEIPVDDNEY